MDLESAKTSFTKLFESIQNADDKIKFMTWISEEYKDDVCFEKHSSICNHNHVENTRDDNMKSKQRKADVLLACIKNTLRNRLPLNATLASEKIVFPTKGEDSNMNEFNCLHVDAFLYDENDVDDLLEEGKIVNCYCVDCKSTNIEDIIFISHSLSKKCAEYIFTKFLPPLDNKVVLDIGSRLGVLLYTAHAYTDACEIIGVELNNEFCKIQRDIISKFKLEDRCKIWEGDVITMIEPVKKADVIILNEIKWFLSLEQQTNMWKFLYKTIKSGCIFVTSPPIDVSLSDLNTGIDLKKWVTEMETINVVDTTEFIEEVNLKFYRIL